MMPKSARVFVAGHRGLVGSAIVRLIGAEGYSGLLTRTRAELNLLDAGAVEQFFTSERPEYVIIAAAKVGGIHANNTYPASFLTENLRIQTNLFESAQRHGVSKLLFLGSSCIYPKHAEQPMRESQLLTGPLEKTNEAYAIAKITGILACRAYNRQHGTRFIAAMPTNLYGPGDDFNPESSHVLPGMLRKFHDAKQQQATHVELWGTGTPRREFLHSDDLARACLCLMHHFEPNGDDVFMNVGSSEDIAIRDVAEVVRDVVGFRGEIVWNASMPDGTPRKWMDSSRIGALGFTPHIPLRQGLEQVYAWFCQAYATEPPGRVSAV
jgi:GDP-L-fucose synthase